ncbi:hypothetical protein BRC77_08975 [Halobacteriales archaeon QH_8_64_26]|nr:MAG: hypothetical protein BRC77_08975 [Halobacteriales archaeon QH_8_64_26]
MGQSFTIGDGDSGSVDYHPDPERSSEGVLVGGFNDARAWWSGEEYVEAPRSTVSGGDTVLLLRGAPVDTAEASVDEPAVRNRSASFGLSRRRPSPGPRSRRSRPA